jgi:hypothetical protein
MKASVDVESGQGRWIGEEVVELLIFDEKIRPRLW